MGAKIKKKTQKMDIFLGLFFRTILNFHRKAHILTVQGSMY